MKNSGKEKSLTRKQLLSRFNLPIIIPNVKNIIGKYKSWPTVCLTEVLPSRTKILLNVPAPSTLKIEEDSDGRYKLLNCGTKNNH